MNIEIYQGSILDCDVDVIVNPANSFLRHGGGLAKIIADAATNSAWRQEQYSHPSIATGDAGWTSAGRLPYKGIIHAVGPIWKDGSLYEEELLEKVYDSCFREAALHDCRSIAFPAISCGLFRFPIEIAASIAVNAAYAYEFDDIDQIVFALIEQEHIDQYERWL